ncbi:S41 family peptidase [Mariniluteicoccus flavus]
MAHAYSRHPHVHADQIVFVADDDLWLVPTSGGRASRLTSDRTPVAYPWFSPDGRKVAWGSTRDGGWDAHVLDLDTGERHRLTHLSAARAFRVAGWLGDRVLVATAHDQMDTGRMRIHAIGFDGSDEVLPLGMAMAVAFGPGDTRAIVTPNGRDSAMWKRYRGGMAGRLWLDRDGTGADWTRLLPDEEAGLYSPGFAGDRLFFSSDLGASLAGDPDGQAQLHSVDLEGGDLRQHTHHTPAEGYVRDPRTDGSTIVFHARGRLFVLDGLDAEPRLLEVDCPGTGRATALIDGTDRLTAIVADQRGNGSLLEWRGAAYFLTHRAGPGRALSALPGVRIREPRPLGADRGVWATDAEGDDCLEIMPLSGEGEPVRLAHGRLGRVLHLTATLDGATIATISHDGAVRLVDADSGEVTEVDRSTEGEATGPRFSPDGRYLVWRQPVAAEGEVGQLRCCDLTDRSVVSLTDGRFDDRDPVFTLDGKHLVFLSRRTFDPAYDEHTFDLSFTDATRPWLVPLRADEPAPFGVAADGWPVAELDPESAETTEKTVAEAGAKPKVTCVIDVEGFEQRITPFPVESGQYAGLWATADGVAWIRKASVPHPLGAGAAPDGRPEDRLEHFSFATRKRVTVATPVTAVSVSGDGKYAVVRHKDEVHLQPVDREVKPDDDAHISVDLKRLRREVDLRAEWRQMFDEQGRLMAQHYWREDMDGVDWAGVLERYRPLVETLSTHDDLVDLLWETVAELNTSHAYVMPKPGDLGRAVGHLGAELTLTDDGARIDALLPGESSDPGARCPLAAAGVGARPGDVIVAVNGQSVADAGGVGPLLQGTVGVPVEVTLRSAEGGVRRVAVVPIADERPLRYHAWVASRSAYVAEKSGGRLGYVHVPDMMAAGWAQIHRDLERATQREGVVVDVRWNHGGHTSQLVIERLSRTVLNWNIARHFASAMTYPAQAIRGPVVLVTNQWAGSDGDIVSMSAQAKGLGPVIGERSWGGVVGIDGRFDLVDGTGVTQPRYGFWGLDYHWGMENHGADPDTEVVVSPADFMGEAEVDRQLDEAISQALARLEQTPAAQPPTLDPPRAAQH